MFNVVCPVSQFPRPMPYVPCLLPNASCLVPRYLELVEFAVALLQAPAESITQSVVYAHHNMMGNGMYLRHGLFLASIILSLGDILIAAVKLCRWAPVINEPACLAALVCGEVAPCVQGVGELAAGRLGSGSRSHDRTVIVAALGGVLGQPGRPCIR